MFVPPRMRFIIISLCYMIYVAHSQRVYPEERQPFVAPGWTPLEGDAHGDIPPLSVIIAVRHRNPHAITTAFDAVSDPDHVMYGKHWTLDQVCGNTM